MCVNACERLFASEVRGMSHRRRRNRNRNLLLGYNTERVVLHPVYYNINIDACWQHNGIIISTETLYIYFGFFNIYFVTFILFHYYSTQTSRVMIIGNRDFLRLNDEQHWLYSC